MMKMRMILGMLMAVGICSAQNLLENGDFERHINRIRRQERRKQTEKGG